MPQNELVAKKSYENLLKTIALNLKRFRKQRGLTQEDMAEYGFNYRFYQKLESGNYSPNLKTLYKLAMAFNIEVEALFRN